MKLGTKISSGYGALLVIVIALGSLAVWKMSAVKQDATVMSRDFMPAVQVANDVERYSLKTMYEMRGYAFTEETNYLANSQQRLAEVKQSLQAARDLTAKSSGAQLAFLKAAADKAEAKVLEYEQLAAQTVAVTTALEKERAAMDQASQAYVTQCEGFLASQNAALAEALTEAGGTNAANLETAMASFLTNWLRREELGRQRTVTANAVLAEAESTAQSSSSTTSTMASTATQTLGTASITLLVGLGLAVVLGVALAFGITRSITRPVKAIATALAAGADQTAAAASQVSAASQSLAEGASEQAASLEETSSSLEEMASMTQRNAENATRVKELGSQARQAGDVGVRDMTEMTEAMAAIKSSSDDIAKIIKTIDEIAFQTNILALNAAAEAAAASQEQSQGIAQVNTAVTQMDKVTQSNAANAEESASAAEELNAQADTLKDSVAQLLQLVDGHQSLRTATASSRIPSSARTSRRPAPSAPVTPVGRSNGTSHAEPTPTRSNQHAAAPTAARQPALPEFKDF